MSELSGVDIKSLREMPALIRKLSPAVRQPAAAVA